MASFLAVKLHIQDDKTRLQFEDILTSQEWQTYFRLQRPGGAETPALVILDMTGSYREVLLRAASIRKQAPQAEIFVTAERIAPSDLVKLFRDDINDFVQLPFQEHEFKQALQRFFKRHEHLEQADANLGTVINLMGSKGGIGTTTIAINLAASLKRIDPDKKVVLVDLDLQYGDIALFLDLQPQYTINHVAQQKNRLAHGEFLQGFLTVHEPSGVAILPSARTDEDGETLTPESVMGTIDALRTMFHYVILDSSHIIHEIAADMLHRLPHLYLVSTLHAPVIRNTKRLLEYLSSFHHSSSKNTHLIINRYQSKYEQYSLREFEEMYINKFEFAEIFYKLPNDYATASKFLNRATPIPTLAKRSKIAKSFSQLASQFTKS